MENQTVPNLEPEKEVKVNGETTTRKRKLLTAQHSL
jgi:ribosome-associated protein YbcJ (S4-like RNA binding protein)